THTHSSQPYRLLFSGTPTTELYTLSLHDALPISAHEEVIAAGKRAVALAIDALLVRKEQVEHLLDTPEGSQREPLAEEEIEESRSEEHTSELQSLRHIVCRLLLEKKKAGRSGELC